jgi:hypothetical protein
MARPPQRSHRSCSSHYPMRRTFLAALLLGCAATAASAAPDEDALARIWSFHARSPGTGQVEVVNACAALHKQFPQSPLAAAADSLQAWHLLKLGRTNEAALALTPLAGLGGSPLADAAALMAKRWLTRVDRGRVEAALQKYYARNVDFPDTLAKLGELPEADRPPPKDRWDVAWGYRRMGFKHIRDLSDQKYVLMSASLPQDAGLPAALARPYPVDAGLKPLRAMPGDGQKRTFAFQGAVSQELLSEGSRKGDWTFVHAGAGLLIFCNGDYWVMMPAP